MRRARLDMIGSGNRGEDVRFGWDWESATHVLFSHNLNYPHDAPAATAWPSRRTSIPRRATGGGDTLRDKQRSDRGWRDLYLAQASWLAQRWLPLVRSKQEITSGAS
jgi:hypothetical protein